MRDDERGHGLGRIDAPFHLGAVGDLTDGQLLERFAGRRDRAAQLAFEALVRRHGPMVLGVCRGVLRDDHAAADAFQATWLVLVRRRSRTPWVRDSLGPWLHGVAHRTALRARTTAARRRRHETAAARAAAGSSGGDRSPDDLDGIVHEEIGRLPERWRRPIVLCLLEGRTIDDAARVLGCPAGTVQSRLARGRERLRARLVRRGVAPSAGMAAVGREATAPPPAVPDPLVRSIVEAATRVAAGGSLVAGAASAQVAALAEGVLAMMFLDKLRSGLVAGLVLLIGIRAAAMVGERPESGPPRPDPPVVPGARPPDEPRPAAVAPILVRAGESIQGAIDAAPPGATIRVEPGTFPESLRIAKPLTLLGAGWDRTTVGPDKVAGLTRQQKDDFFARLEATSDPDERAKIAAELAKRPYSIPTTLVVTDARDVVIRGIRWRSPSRAGAGNASSDEALALWDHAGGTVAACAFVGPGSNGIRLTAGADLAVDGSLIAAVWGTGLVAPRGARLRLTESDVRNCYYAGVTLGTGDATIERCRISGAAWHGIRYDNCSPTISNNQIFANARSGIYASGKTGAVVRGNVFYRNEMGAMSCWFRNADAIEANTLIGNLREGISVANGDSKPTLARNVFVDSPIGVWCTYANDRNGQSGEQPPGDPKIADNFFFKVPKVVQVLLAEQPLPPGNSAGDPRVGGPAEGFRLAADSPARAAGAGALDPAPFASPFAIQPEEAAIIPDGETRSSVKWKKTGRPD